MDTGKTSTYLKYAIGEIVLVVIGILIALQINNWNERRKTGLLEASYNQSIKNDLKHDHETIEYIIKDTKLLIEAHELLMQQLKSFDTIKDSRPLYTLMRENTGFVDLKIGDNTIETLKNSGNIEIISSKPVRESIQTYYDTVEVIYMQQNYMNAYVINNRMAKFFNYLACEKGIENNTKVPFDDRARENLPDTYAFLNHWVHNLNGYVNLLNNLSRKNTALIALINSNYPEK